MAASSFNLQLNEITTKQQALSDVENKLLQIVGPKIFDYASVLKPNIDFNIELNITNEKIKQIVNEYIEAGIELLKQYQITPQQEARLEDMLFSVMHDVYLLRLMEAKSLFGQYQLKRILTQLEDLLLSGYQRKGSAEELPVEFVIDIPNAFIFNQLNEIDLIATKKQEATLHIIASHLSMLPHLASRKTLLFKDFRADTIKGMVPRLYKDKLTDIFEEICEFCFLYFTPYIYEYIKRGLSPAEAQTNVQSYFLSIMNKVKKGYPPEMEGFLGALENKLLSLLSKLDQLYTSTKQVITQEVSELVLEYFKGGIFIPSNYYNLVIREPKASFIKEDGYDAVIDLFLYQDNGELLTMPVETYAVDLTVESKRKIFNYVTNKIENPLFTLDNYLNGIR